MIQRIGSQLPSVAGKVAASSTASSAGKTQPILSRNSITWRKIQFPLEETMFGPRIWQGCDIVECKAQIKVFNNKIREPFEEAVGFLAYARIQFMENKPFKGFASIMAAEPAFSVLQTARPNDPEIASALSNVRLLQGERSFLYEHYQEAIATFTVLLEDSTSLVAHRSWAHYFRGASYQALGDSQNALADLNEAKILGQEQNLKQLQILSEYRCFELDADNEVPAQANIPQILLAASILPKAKALVQLQGARVQSKLGLLVPALSLLLGIVKQARSFSDKYILQWIIAFVTSATVQEPNDLEGSNQFIEGLDLILAHKDRLPPGLTSFAYGAKGRLLLFQNKLDEGLDLLRRAKKSIVGQRSDNETLVNQILIKPLWIKLMQLEKSGQNSDQRQAILLELLDCVQFMLNNGSPSLEELDELHYKLAQVYIRLKDFDKCLESLNYIIDQNLPSRTEALLDRGAIMVIQKNFDLAEIDFSSLIELPNELPLIRARAYYNRGIVYLAKGKFDLVLSDLRATLNYSDVAVELPMKQRTKQYISVALFAQGEAQSAYDIWKELGQPKEIIREAGGDEFSQNYSEMDKLFNEYFRTMLEMDAPKPDHELLNSVKARIDKTKEDLFDLIGFANQSLRYSSALEYLRSLQKRILDLEEQLDPANINSELLVELARIETQTATQYVKLVG